MEEALKDDGVEILKLGDGFFPSLEQFLHFFDIDLRRRIVSMPHHLLHLSGIGIIQQGKGGGGGGMPQTMDRNTRLLHAGQEQPFGNDALNRSGTQRPLGWHHHASCAIEAGRTCKARITFIQWSRSSSATQTCGLQNGVAADRSSDFFGTHAGGVQPHSHVQRGYMRLWMCARCTGPK